MDVWAVDAQTERHIEETLALGSELTLSVRQGMPQCFTRRQVRTRSHTKTTISHATQFVAAI